MPTGIRRRNGRAHRLGQGRGKRWIGVPEHSERFAAGDAGGARVAGQFLDAGLGLQQSRPHDQGVASLGEDEEPFGYQRARAPVVPPGQVQIGQ